MRQQDETPVAPHLPRWIAGTAFTTVRQQAKTPVLIQPLLDSQNPVGRKISPTAPSSPARRNQRIEILCFPEEKEAIQRRAGKVPLARWARIRLLGRHTAPSDELVPVGRVIGFFETVERLALEGDLAQLIETARSVQRHLRSTVA